MHMRSKVAAVAVAVAATAFLAGCGPKKAAAPAPTHIPVASQPATSAPASPAAKTLTPGNCTLYTKADATTLIGPPNIANNAIDIKTDGGQKIDVCSYIDLQGQTNLQGVSYAVVLYDSAATAFAEAQKVRTEMLTDANEHSWAVTPLTTPVPGAGPLLGGTGTKNDQGITVTLAVVGTNVGSYLVVALGASTVSTSKAEADALAVFTALAATTSS